MSKFVIVNNAPKGLRKGEAVIRMPNFMEEVVEVTNKNSPASLTGVNILRSILATIGNRYDLSYNPFSVPVSNYTGIAVNSPADLSRVVVNIVNEHSPSLIDSYITSMIKSRPLYTKVIYFVGPVEKGKLFHLEGFSPITVDEVDQYLDLKKKKSDEQDE